MQKPLDNSNSEVFEKVLQVEEFKRYLRSFSHFVVPIIILIAGLFWTFTFGYLAIDTAHKHSDGSKIFAMILYIIFGLIGLFITGLALMMLLAHWKDARFGKIRIRLIEIQEITHFKHSRFIKYKFGSKSNLLAKIPNPKWLIQNENLPQKAVIYLGYHSNLLLQMELLDSGEKFSVLEKYQSLK
ncbi:MAG: hypothetical protein RMJ97_04290 [Raineya sp.]|nr:hypothetical protein [Raineya sp.]MDW8296084.1 hypothetical protein [Raineya sp.]